MTEEIFGPLLPIITVRNKTLFDTLWSKIKMAIIMSFLFHNFLFLVQLKNIQESIEFINSRPKPLAIYAFTKDEALKKRIVSETSSGSVVFNDIMIQVLPIFSYSVSV